MAANKFNANRLTSTVIDEEVQRRGELGIRNFMQVNNLQIPENPVEICTTTDSACATTLKIYSDRWEDLLRFCYLRGDYRSACILNRRICPSNPLPCKPETLAEYIEYKSSLSDTLLNIHGTTVPALDVLGKPIYCQNAWHAPTPIMQYLAAILKVHKYYEDLRGMYVEACIECKNLNTYEIANPTQTGTVWRSCQQHCGQPRILPKGNPRNSFVLENAVKKYYSYCKGWEVKGNTQFLPSEVRDLRDNLVNTGVFGDFQLYVMIVLVVLLNCYSLKWKILKKSTPYLR